MRTMLLTVLALVAIAWGASAVHAQVPYVTYYRPTTVQYSTPTVTYSAPTSYYRVPTTTYYPTTRYYTPTTAYYAPSTYYAPARYTTSVTRYRPLLGGRVTRYVTGYSPVYYSY